MCYCACKWCNPPLTLANHLQSISLPPFPFYPNDTIAPNDVLFPGNRQYSLSSLVTPSSLLSALCPLLSARIHQRFHFALPRRQRSLLCQDVNFQKEKKKWWKKESVLAWLCIPMRSVTYPDGLKWSWTSQVRREQIRTLLRRKGPDMGRWLMCIQDVQRNSF